MPAYEAPDAETLSKSSRYRHAVYLISKGVPYDTAFSLVDEERMALVVAFGEMEGRFFDWKSGVWLDDATKTDSLVIRHPTHYGAVDFHNYPPIFSRSD